MKRFGLLVLLMVCLSLPAFAADSQGDIFGGFSVFHSKVSSFSSTPVGWQAAASFNVKPMIAVVADFGGQYKNGGNALQYMFGPRYVVRQDKVSYFAHALFGGDHFNNGGGNAFAMGFGGGVDVKAGEKLYVRVIQFDWIPLRQNGFNSNNNTRYGFGVVYPFGSK